MILSPGNPNPNRFFLYKAHLFFFWKIGGFWLCKSLALTFVIIVDFIKLQFNQKVLSPGNPNPNHLFLV